MDQEYFDKMSRATRIQNQAKAVLQRAATANIPNSFLRIDQTTFRGLLDDQYYTDRKQSADKVADVMFNKPEYLFTRRFILVDGGAGAGLSRVKAGHAILFRLITCDYGGVHEQGKELVHKLNSGFVQENSNRVDIVERLKAEDVLFISDISMRDFRMGTKGAYEAGSFLDEILESRMHNDKVTIISFVEPIRLMESGEGSDGVCGNFLMRLFHADTASLAKVMKEEFKVLRIRVKGD